MGDVVDFEPRKGIVGKKEVSDEFAEIPDSLILIEAVGAALAKCGIYVKHGEMPELIIEEEGKEYGFTIRPIDQHRENLAIWQKHIVEKHGPELDKPTSDEPLPLSVEEICVLRDYGYGDGRH